VIFFNHSSIDVQIYHGDRIAQIICERHASPQLLQIVDADEADRGSHVHDFRTANDVIEAKLTTDRETQTPSRIRGYKKKATANAMKHIIIKKRDENKC
jgi:hypothetical protein